jgi:Flp pilus assembly protein TadG
MKRIVKPAFKFFIRSCSSAFARSRFLRDETGGALVELSLGVYLLLVPMLIGTVEMGTMMFDSIEVSNAAHAGAMYGMMGSTYAADSAGVQQAAKSDASDFGTNLIVTPTVYYACSEALGGTQYSSQSAASTACTGNGNHPLEFIQVTTSATVTPPITCPGLATSYTLAGSSVMEVEE